MTMYGQDQTGQKTLRLVSRGCAMVWSAVAAAFVLAMPASAQPGQPTIVLIGERMPDYQQGQHDWPDGVIKMNRLIQGSPEFATWNPVVKLYPAGFPADLSELDDASV